MILNELQQIDTEIHNIHDQCYRANCKKCNTSCPLSEQIEKLKRKRLNLEVSIQCDDQWAEEY